MAAFFANSDGQSLFVAETEQYFLIKRSIQTVNFLHSTIAANSSDLSLEHRRLVVDHLVPTFGEQFQKYGNVFERVKLFCLYFLELVPFQSNFEVNFELFLQQAMDIFQEKRDDGQFNLVDVKSDGLQEILPKVDFCEAFQDDPSDDVFDMAVHVFLEYLTGGDIALLRFFFTAEVFKVFQVFLSDLEDQEPNQIDFGPTGQTKLDIDSVFQLFLVPPLALHLLLLLITRVEFAKVLNHRTQKRNDGILGSFGWSQFE